MKKVALFATISPLALAEIMTASAQHTASPSPGLPDSSSPAAILPADGGLNWSGMDYVDALKYVWANGTDAYGAGFFTGISLSCLSLAAYRLGSLNMVGTTIADICESRIIANGVGSHALSSFRPASAPSRACWLAGWIQPRLDRSHGTPLGAIWWGRQKYCLSTTREKVINFPDKLWPDYGTRNPSQPGSCVRAVHLHYGLVRPCSPARDHGRLHSKGWTNPPPLIFPRSDTQGAATGKAAPPFWN